MTANVQIKPATTDRWSDVREVLDGAGEQGCWCQAWRGDAIAREEGESRTQTLRRQMKGGPPHPGMSPISTAWRSDGWAWRSGPIRRAW